MSLERTLELKGISDRYPIILAGMGAGVSLEPLASEVGRLGGVGTVSSVGLDQFTRKRLLMTEEVEDVRPRRMDFVEATRREIADTKARGGVAAINIMCALPRYYDLSVEGAVKGGVDMIVSGAGLPLSLPDKVKKFTGTHDHPINIVPIVSSARAFELLCKKWERYGYRPDAVVLEGPKAGGHLGWNYSQIEKSQDFMSEFEMFKLLPGMLDVASKYPNDFGPIPVIVAGGIYTHDDIIDAMYRGAAAVVMGTRFTVADECSFSDPVKDMIVASEKDDIIVADASWGSPCMYPFRYLKNSPHKKSSQHFCICSALFGAGEMDNSDVVGTKGFPASCPEGYVLHKNECPAHDSADYNALVTVGSEAYRIDKRVSTKELMEELIGQIYK